MSTHIICFHGEIRKNINMLVLYKAMLRVAFKHKKPQVYTNIQFKSGDL